MNRPTPPNPLDIQPADLELPINREKPSRDEIWKAIVNVKNDNAAENIPAEALKVNINTTAEMLYPLCARIWESEELQAEWKEIHLI